MMNIASVFSLEILDSRGNPTLETEIVLENGPSITVYLHVALLVVECIWGRR